MIIDATNLIVGRMATEAAKRALLGEKIDIVNCENAVITGKRKYVLTKYKQKADRGVPLKGPYLPKMPDRFVRRIIRGMLPHRQFKGKEAFKRIMCYTGLPDSFHEKKLDSVKDADISKVPSYYYVSVKEICEHLGGRC